MKTLILTASIDNESQLFFDTLRSEHFPKERNFLKAHLTLFHKLPDLPETYHTLQTLKVSSFSAEVSEVKSIGNGVAYFITSATLDEIQLKLKHSFITHLSAQDEQKFSAHITIQNKVTAENARALLQSLQANFLPFQIKITGLDLWYYLDGPWQHAASFPFINLDHQ